MSDLSGLSSASGPGRVDSSLSSLCSENTTVSVTLVLEEGAGNFSCFLFWSSYSYVVPILPHILCL